MLAAVALAGGTLAQIVIALLVVVTIEAVLVHSALWRRIRSERAPLPQGFMGRAQKFGLFTILQKGCAMLCGGSVVLLVLAPHHPATTVALLGLAVDLVGNIVSVTSMPFGNLVAPYLSQTSEEPGAQALAASRVTKFSSLLYCFSIGAGALVLPWFVPTVYGGEYAGAAWFALLMLLPAAFENWVRGCCSPMLLRNGRYRDLMRVNILQAVVTLAVLAVAHRLPVSVALVAISAARVSVSALNLAAMGRIVQRVDYPCAAYRACDRGVGVPRCARVRLGNTATGCGACGGASRDLRGNILRWPPLGRLPRPRHSPPRLPDRRPSLQNPQPASAGIAGLPRMTAVLFLVVSLSAALPSAYAVALVPVFWLLGQLFIEPGRRTYVRASGRDRNRCRPRNPLGEDSCSISPVNEISSPTGGFTPCSPYFWPSICWRRWWRV